MFLCPRFPPLCPEGAAIFAKWKAEHLNNIFAEECSLVLTGVVVNVAAVLEAFLGSLVTVPRIKDTIMQGLGLAVCLIGISMGLATANIIIPGAGLVVGGGLGAWIGLEKRLEGMGQRLGTLVKAKGRFTEGFLTATLVYCVGAMAVVGSLNSGLTGDHQVLFTKAVLDGTTAVFFTASLGIGVAFSAIPLFIYQGGIALCAVWWRPVKRCSSGRAYLYRRPFDSRHWPQHAGRGPDQGGQLATCHIVRGGHRLVWGIKKHPSWVLFKYEPYLVDALSRASERRCWTYR